MKPVGYEHTVPLDVAGLPDFHEDNTPARQKGGALAWFQNLLTPEQYNPPLLTDDEYVKKALACSENAISVVEEPGWKEHKRGTSEGDIVHTKTTDKYGKLFLLTSIVDFPAEKMFENLHVRIEDVCIWNPTILESKTIRRINDEVDIAYQVTQGGGAGAVKPREFINLRCGRKWGDRYISSGLSVEYPGYPPGKFLRAENRIGAWVMTPIDKDKCQFQWLLGCDLKGWIPQYVVDVAMPTVLLDFLHYIRAFAKNKKKDQPTNKCDL